MKLSAKLTTLIALILAFAGIAMPVVLGQQEGTFYAYWLMGLGFNGKTGEIATIESEGSLWVYWSPIFMMALILAVVHFSVSLWGKNSNKRLNRAAAGDLCLAAGLGYFFGVYTGVGLFFWAFPLGLISMVLAGIMGLWAGRLTRAEENTRQIGGA
jgi:hypothetical protein